MSKDKLSKILFVFSLVVFALLYGVLAGTFDWFPKGVLERASRQAAVWQRTSGDRVNPSYTHPQVYDRQGVRVKKPDKVQPGVTLITSLWDRKDSKKLEGEVRLIDQKGKILHQWKVDREKLFPNSMSIWKTSPKQRSLHGTHLFPNGDLLVNVEGVGTVRLDSCSQLVWRLSEFNNHTIERADDGTFWIPTFSQEPRVGSERYSDGYPGLDSKPVRAEQILHLMEKGKVLKRIKVFDILYKNDLQRYIPKVLGSSGSKRKIDMAHLNDVEPLSSSMADEYPLFEAGDLLISLRKLNLVLVFNPETLEVKWHSSEPFNKQHDPDFIGRGWIGVFDNNIDYTKRGTMAGGSRIVAVQPHTKKTKVLFPTEKSAPFYTSRMGKWQKLENGNLLLVESYAGRVVEVTPEGETVWEWIHKPVGDSKVPELGGATRFDLTREEIASWKCSSIESSNNSN